MTFVCSESRCIGLPAEDISCARNDAFGFSPGDLNFPVDEPAEPAEANASLGDDVAGGALQGAAWGAMGAGLVGAAFGLTVGLVECPEVALASPLPGPKGFAICMAAHALLGGAIGAAAGAVIGAAGGAIGGAVHHLTDDRL